MRFRPVAFLCRLLLVFASALAVSGLAVIAFRYPIPALLVSVVVAWRNWRGWRGSGDAFGTARPSGFADLLAYRMLRGGDHSLILGRTSYINPPSRRLALRSLVSPQVPSPLACRLALAAFLAPKWLRREIISVNDHVHVGTFAPSGAGKGVGAVVPNLRHYRGACVVNDTKGENYKLTHKHRRKRFGHRVVRLDPFYLQGPGGDGLNPLDFIDAGAAELLDQCRDLANMLVVRSGTEHDPHWNDRAEQVLTAFICFVCACERDPARRNLLTVRALIASRDAYTAAMQMMRQTEGFHGVVKRQGDQLTWLQDKELGSVLSVAQRHTAWMDSPAVAGCLSASSFDPRALKQGRMTAYLILPPERLVTLAPLMRTWLGTMLRVLTRGEASEKRPVLFLIDEAAQLGRMQILEDALTIMRGYGIRLWLFFQSVGQLKKCYGDNAQTVLDNLATQQYFGTHDYESAEHLSKRIGDCTLLLRSLNDTRGHSQPTATAGTPPSPGSTSSSSSVSVSETGRRWLKPEEVLTLPPDLALCFHKNLSVIPARLLAYYNAPEFRWGGSGQGRGLGLAGTAACIALLLASLLIAGIATRLPPPGSSGRPVVSSAGPTATGRGYPPARPHVSPRSASLYP